MFFENSFISFTETEDEISLLMESSYLPLFPEEILSTSDIYRPLERFAKLDFSTRFVTHFTLHPIVSSLHVLALESLSSSIPSS